MRQATLERIGAPAPFELWQLDLETPPTDDALGLLAPAERGRAERFVFERDRRRYLAARSGLRRLLALRTGLAGERLRLAEGAFGKPYLEGAPGCAFNLSHSADVALIALADAGEIGVDVEALRPIEDAAALAERHFTAAERAALARTAASERVRAFLRCWTRKEACLKAIGSGLTIGADTFEAGIEGAPRLVRIGTPDGSAAVEVRSLPDRPDRVAALARVVTLS